jgi:hypothetical protein
MSVGQFLLLALGLSILMIIGGFASSQAALAILGIISFIVFAALRVGWEDGHRQSSLKRHAEYAETCEWCGHELPVTSSYCATLGVFCPPRRYYQHEKYKHDNQES